MKCSTAQHWLLCSGPDRLPADVAHHFRRCRNCARRRQRLGLLESVVCAEPAPTLPAASRARLMQGLDRQPAPPPAGRHAVPARRPLPWLRIAAAAAVSLAFGLGWLAAPRRDGDGGLNFSSRPVAAVAPPAEEKLLTRFLERDKRLAAATPLPGEQRLQVMTDMAGDLRAEAIDRAQRDSVEGVNVVVNLYQRVVRQGVVGRALALLPQQRQQVEALLGQLKRGEAEIETAVARSRPQVAELLRPMGEATRKAGDDIRASRVPDAQDPDAGLLPEDGSWQTVLTVLVLQGVQLAEEEDEHCREECLKRLNDLEPLLKQTGRVPDGPDAARAAEAEKERAHELEKTLQQMGRTLRKMKGDRPPPRDRDGDQAPPGKAKEAGASGKKKDRDRKGTSNDR